MTTELIQVYIVWAQSGPIKTDTMLNFICLKTHIMMEKSTQ